MLLRTWQKECIQKAKEKYENNVKHFLALATPGAGKTLMASALAKKLYDEKLIDIILCFSPSSVVSTDFADELSQQFSARFDGSIGALGDSFTYQALSSLNENVWQLFEQYRVFVIFDEIHHCAGSTDKDANSWGSPILNLIKEKSAFTISLTGTPWRSDSLPIALSNYCNESGQINCDYVYGLKEAISDKVCRVPQIIALDNDKITLTSAEETKSFASFFELLKAKVISYSEIVTNELVIENLLLRAITKLNEIRSINSNAGGLIIASSISHAYMINTVMRSRFNGNATIVTSSENEPDKIIKQFRQGDSEWLISVGMVSEGTNIPRLQVCCNLTNYRTELYFRQILGRILRMTDSVNQDAFMFMPAEPNLIDFAIRVAEDVPAELGKVKVFDIEIENENSIVLEPLGSSSAGLTEEDDLFDIFFDRAASNANEPEENPLSAFTAPSPRISNTITLDGNFQHKPIKPEGLNELLLIDISDEAHAKLEQLNRVII
ncbi:DEAD/DEAH box helicase [Pseudoalteromonas sp. SG44-8]|uniref:DEAD/DEAH box helicase n=1 Tax=Pseudoalteromonas sp. SG44-8 TaxID=2760958 RepID=UPI0016049D28|nr:DEAD/DEAH box helicase family protein [Pseudoalteromonas sp. SG44-8]MBB1398091.1 DEAD/DEAH box helicase family protein [Pseudoalteromonas sp. SG44-8]